MNIQILFLHFRYYLEMITVLAFGYLIIHTSGHGILKIMESGHAHENHSLEEFLYGILLGSLFVWIWQLKKLKKWIPCQHDHCHTEIPITHIAAIIALCIHFFPEAHIREMILAESPNTLTSWMSIIGFGTHILIDIIIALSISQYWKTKAQKWISFLIIMHVWILANTMTFLYELNVSDTTEGVFLILSSFLLAMFIHKPHKPKKCHSCAH